MKRSTTAMLLLSAATAFSQAGDAPAKFEISDIHPSAKTQNPFSRLSTHGDRYDLKSATMVDLIRTAYGFDPDKILGGPNWLELDRFDIAAKMPAGTTPDTQKVMLQSLLADRFKLKTHSESQPMATYALTVGSKKPQLKESDGEGEPGCKPQSTGVERGEGSSTLMMANGGGPPITLSIGPDRTILYVCRNMTMASFAAGLRSMMGAGLTAATPVMDETGLKGAWNFDLRWTFGLIIVANPSDAPRITIFDAVEKQLGLKLEPRQVPTPVIVVDSVNRKPTDNPPNLAEVMPAVAAPTEFEVASIKPSVADVRVSRFQVQTGGRLDVQGMPLRFLISRAFNTNNNDQIVGLPAWVDSERFDILAKAASTGASAPPMDIETVAPMIRKLLVDRFKMTYHSEDRPLQAYSLVAAKPKMKKADPDGRISCKFPPAAPGAPPGTRVLVCQNTSMAELAERLQNNGPGLNLPIQDATGIEGRWDFTLSFSQIAGMNFGGRGGDAGQAGAPAADAPSGALTIFEALEKQLGLKLETQKRPISVFVVDHIERPTEN